MNHQEVRGGVKEKEKEREKEKEKEYIVEPVLRRVDELVLVAPREGLLDARVLPQLRNFLRKCRRDFRA
jgi:hypothetical protein